MFVDRRNGLPVLLALLCAAGARADLADIGARVDYGFYAQDAAVVEAALRELERRSADEAGVSYHRGLAAWRLAQLNLQRGRTAGAELDTCIESAEHAARQGPASAEPWVLVAACSALAAAAEPARALFHRRRFDQAVARARAIEPDNARIPLVEAWRIAYDPARLDPAVGAALTPLLETAVAAFRAQRAQYLGADWGEAEALALLGAIYLHRGEIRAARDVIEQSLLAAPGYRHALELRDRFSVSRAEPAPTLR